MKGIIEYLEFDKNPPPDNIGSGDHRRVNLTLIIRDGDDEAALLDAFMRMAYVEIHVKKEH